MFKRKTAYTFAHDALEHFQAKRAPVRVKKMRQNKNLERRSDSLGTGKALAPAAMRPHPLLWLTPYAAFEFGLQRSGRHENILIAVLRLRYRNFDQAYFEANVRFANDFAGIESQAERAGDHCGKGR
jgi:hypothetical protein